MNNRLITLRAVVQVAYPQCHARPTGNGTRIAKVTRADERPVDFLNAKHHEAIMFTEPAAKEWIVREQTVEDPTSGLTFQFELSPEGRPVLRVFGDALPFGNREVHFDSAGWEAMAETCVGMCQPVR